MKFGICVVLTVKNHEKYGKNTFFSKKSEINQKLLTFLQGELFLYTSGKNCIQDANILGTPAPLL